MRNNATSLTISFVCLLTFSSPVFGQTRALVPPVPAPANELSELNAWQAAERVDTPEAFSSYLRRFPNGTFASLARSRSTPLLLSDMMPVAPEPANSVVQIEMAAARKAWDEAAWARVSAANTHSAYREYLLHLPNGIYLDQALRAYKTSLPEVPSVKPVDCTIATQTARVTRPFVTRNAFPSYALERWTDGLIIGVNHIDYTGAPLGLTIAYASDPSMFSAGARQQAGQMFYAPRITNCGRVADVSPLFISYRTGSLPFESRANAEGPMLQARLGTRLDGELPSDKAVLVQFTPSPGVSVYEISFESRFPPLLTQVVEGQERPVPLVGNRMFVSVNNPSITLRVSSRDKPNSKVQNKGRFHMTIRQVFNQTSL